jgi:nucleotide-binding universal stress UspA family protein
MKTPAPRRTPKQSRKVTTPACILLPTDGTKLSEKAVRHGIALAKRFGAKVIVLTVLPMFHMFTTDTQMLTDTPGQFDERMRKQAAKILRPIVLAAKAAGLACATVQLGHEHPYQAIIDTAAAQRCDLIVMASHGRGGAAAIILGSETLKVLTHSKVPVLVYR